MTRLLLSSAFALGAMMSLAVAEPIKPTTNTSTTFVEQTTKAANISTLPSEPMVLTETQMDKVTAGVCIGNCPGGGNTQVGVNACVIVKNCQPKNENN
jgi:hypothetical protein